MNAERVTLSAEEIRAWLIERGKSFGEADLLSLELAKEINEGPSAGIAIDTDFNSSGLTVMGTLRFHFRLGQEFYPKVIKELTQELIERVQLMTDYGYGAPLSSVLGAANDVRYGRIIGLGRKEWPIRL
jgi:hypothetical protein